jgi:hypothetical protein
VRVRRKAMRGAAARRGSIFFFLPLGQYHPSDSGGRAVARHASNNHFASSSKTDSLFAPVVSRVTVLCFLCFVLSRFPPLLHLRPPLPGTSLRFIISGGVSAYIRIAKYRLFSSLIPNNSLRRAPPTEKKRRPLDALSAPRATPPAPAFAAPVPSPPGAVSVGF